MDTSASLSEEFWFVTYTMCQHGRASSCNIFWISIPIGQKKWATWWQNQQNGMCAQQKSRSAWSSTLQSESSLSAWRNLGSLATHWAHSEDSDQTGQMPRLIWVFVGRTVILLVLSWGGSNVMSVSTEFGHIVVEYCSVLAHSSKPALNECQVFKM